MKRGDGRTTCVKTIMPTVGWPSGSKKPWSSVIIVVAAYSLIHKQVGINGNEHDMARKDQLLHLIMDIYLRLSFQTI